MTRETKHTPTPWLQFDLIAKKVVTKDDELIADATTAENAAFIVTACNAHEELVAALEALLSEYQNADNVKAEQIAIDALRKARGEA